MELTSNTETDRNEHIIEAQFQITFGIEIFQPMPLSLFLQQCLSTEQLQTILYRKHTTHTRSKITPLSVQYGCSNGWSE